MNMTVGNTLFKKRGKSLSHLKTQVDYYLVRRNQRKFLEDIKVLTSAECITQYKWQGGLKSSCHRFFVCGAYYVSFQERLCEKNMALKSQFQMMIVALDLALHISSTLDFSFAKYLFKICY